MFGKDLSVEALERVYNVTDRLHFKIKQILILVDTNNSESWTNCYF